MSSSTLPVTKSTIGSFTAEAFAEHLATQKNAPAWWLDRKRAAYEKFAALPLPSRTDEAWRFSNISTLTLDGFAPTPVSDLKSEIPKPFGLPTLTFFNNLQISDRSSKNDLTDKGVIVTTIAEATTQHADLLKAHFMAQPQKLGSEKFASLHTAFVADGAFIYIPRRVELDEPIIITHVAPG